MATHILKSYKKKPFSEIIADNAKHARGMWNVLSIRNSVIKIDIFYIETQDAYSYQMSYDIFFIRCNQYESTPVEFICSLSEQCTYAMNNNIKDKKYDNPVALQNYFNLSIRQCYLKLTSQELYTIWKALSELEVAEE